MENKYYTPEIEEFFPGFHYYYVLDSKFDDGVKEREIWRGFRFLIDDEFTCLYDFEEELSKCRVKYLDKEDMEELLNRKQLKGNDVELNFQLIINDDLFYEFDYNTYTKALEIQKIMLYANGLMDTCEYLFQGIIKNKSELKKLLIQLNILTSAKNLNINSIN